LIRRHKTNFSKILSQAEGDCAAIHNEGFAASAEKMTEGFVATIETRRMRNCRGISDDLLLQPTFVKTRTSPAPYEQVGARIGVRHAIGWHILFVRNNRHKRRI